MSDIKIKVREYLDSLEPDIDIGKTPVAMHIILLKECQKELERKINKEDAEYLVGLMDTALGEGKLLGRLTEHELYFKLKNF